MKILLLLIVFLFITNTACWNLNDIYKQLVDGIKNDKKDNRNYEKRTETNPHSTEWKQRSSSPENVEVQSYDVETKPIKKNVPSKPEEKDIVMASFRPTEAISNFQHGDSIMAFNKKYGGKKQQVSAWSEWSQKAADPAAFAPLKPEIHNQASKKTEEAKVKPIQKVQAVPTSPNVHSNDTIKNNTSAQIKPGETSTASENSTMHSSQNAKPSDTLQIASPKEPAHKPTQGVEKLMHRSDTSREAVYNNNADKDLKYPSPSFELGSHYSALSSPSYASLKHDEPVPTAAVLVATNKITKAEKPTDAGTENTKLLTENTPTKGFAQASEVKNATGVEMKIEENQETASMLKVDENKEKTKTFESKDTNLKPEENKIGSASPTSTPTQQENLKTQQTAQQQQQVLQDLADLPNIRGLMSSNFIEQPFKLGECKIDAKSGVCGVKLVVDKNTCDGKVSFTALMARILPNVDLAEPSNELIVHGKYDVNDFTIDRCKGHISFNLTCRELLDVIPNKLRLSKARMHLNFSYEQTPKAIGNFDMKIAGALDLSMRNRRLNAIVEKPMASTLFKIEMSTTDLELPEFTRLFTEEEIAQQDLPPDLATLVTSSLRNPRITGLYDESGAFEFLAVAKSPASIFPSQPMVYVIIQKPRLGKVVSGLIASFDSALYQSFLSSILNQDLSKIPLFNDVRTDMAIGISPDGLFVVKDDSFNKEVGSLFNTGKTIKKGLTVKARLPIKKLIGEQNSQNLPETILINMEVKGNRMHIEFPDDFQVPLSRVAELFAQRGQDLNIPKQTNIDDTQLLIKTYEIDNIDKKSLTIHFTSNTPMKIGSLMILNNVEANLKRDELSKWTFVASGDYKLGATSVSVSLTGQNTGFLITSNPSSIRSGLLVDLLDQKRAVIKPEMTKYHMDDFVIENFKVAGSLTNKNIIRFSGKPTVFGVEDAKIEFIATEEANKEDALAMGTLFRNVDLDSVFGRMLDRKMQRSSWATGVNIGLILSNSKTPGELQFETEGLIRTKIMPGAHLRVLLMRPEATLCKGDSLCRVLSSEMPHGSAFHLAGAMSNGVLRLSAPINDAITLSKSLQLHGSSLQVHVVDSVNIYVLASLNLRGVAIPFTGDMRVDNTGQLQLNMASKDNWEQPFGLKNIQFSNSNLSATFEPGLPVPTFDLKSRIIFGKDPSDAVKSVEAIANIKLNSQDPSKNSFTANLRDVSFEKLASACGTKKPLLRFQQEAALTEDALLTYDQNNKEEHVEGGENNMTDYDYKGELKVTGRMHILGQNAEYTIKFLHQESQLLTEVWLPDIGVNQGMLTIRAGLKQQKPDSEIQTINGPTLLIRMDPFTNSAVIVGKVSTLGFSRISAIKVEDNGFSAKIFGSLPGNVNSDISLRSDYTENIQNANFQASSCLPIQQPIKSELYKLLQDTATKTKKTLISAEERVTTTEKIYETTKAMIDKNKKRSADYTTDIRQRAETMTKLRKGIKKHCVKDCGSSCMGVPSWKRSGISLNGRNVIGAPSWDSCKQKIPDLNCITRCLGRKVIENVKANNKQIELQGLMSSLADTKRSLQDARALVERARKLVDSTLDGLERVNKEIKVGVDISKFLNEGKPDEAIVIRQACFKDSLNNAERSLVKFDVDLNLTNETKKFTVAAALDGNLEKSIAEGIANQLYPGYFEFSKKLEQVKVLLSSLDGEKAEIEKEIDKTSDSSLTTNQKSQIVWNSEEDDFRKLAYGELPRFTLSDDETIHAFEEKSIWQIAPQNNPLFDQAPGDNQIVTNKNGRPKSLAEEFDKETDCGKIRSSVNRYSDIINPLSEFTENFLQEKIMFYRQKNRRLADLRMIDDQIKSDCFLENCTMEDMGNALSYLARAREGTLKWSSVIENQIEEQNKVALNYFSKRTADIIEADKGVSLRQYIAKVKEFAQRAIKKSDVAEKSETDEKIQKLARELHSLLLGVKNSEELSKAAPKIFSMKRQIQSLKRNKIPCSEKQKVAQKKSPTAKLDKKLRAVKLGEITNATTTTTSKPTNKEITTTTTKKSTRSRTTKVQPTEQENPVLKDTVMKYDNDLINTHLNRDGSEEQEESSNNRFTENELLDPQQNVANQYFINNNEEQQNVQNNNMYNPYNTYWGRYVK